MYDDYSTLSRDRGQPSRSRSSARSPRPSDVYGRRSGHAHYNEERDTARQAAGWSGELQYDDDGSREQGECDEYEDRGRELRRSHSDHGHEERSGRSFTPPPRQKPSRTLILEGLPLEIKEDDVLDGFDAFMESSRFASDHIKAVRLRTNKMGRRICFVEFFNTNDAEDFVERNRHAMTFDLPGPGGMELEPVPVTVNYSRSKEDGGRDGGRGEERDDGSWICSNCSGHNYSRRVTCYKCGRDGYDDGAGAGLILTGETDEAPFPSQYLVIRDLEPSVTEEVLAKGITKLFMDESRQPAKEAPPAKKLKSTAPAAANTANLGAKPGSLRRVFLMRDRRTNESWRYGFAEFWTLDDAQAAAAKFRASPKFTISSKPVTVGFIHTGVFIPVLDPSTAQNDLVFSPVYNPNVQLKYWDSRVYPSIHAVNMDRPDGVPDPEDAIKATEKGEVGGDLGAQQNPGSKKAKVKDTAIAMASQMQMWTKKRAELHRGRGNAGGEEQNDAGTGVMDASSHGVPHTDPANVALPAISKLESTRPFGPRAAHHKDTLTSYGVIDDQTACLLCLLRFETAQDLRDHEVLGAEHGLALQDTDKALKAVAQLAQKGKYPEKKTRRIPRDRSDPAPAYVSYADDRRCLVCRRRFKSLGMLRLHERESELHRVSVADAANVEKAVAELAVLGKVPVKMRPRTGVQYRDRARERRKAFGPSVKGKGAAKASGVETKKEKEVKKEKEAQPSKGAALLSKMGWTAGQGLGADGTGRAEAIQTVLYEPGVGLGAEGGKVGDAAAEASRRTTGYYSDFVKQTKDKARERYEKLG